MGNFSDGGKSVTAIKGSSTRAVFPDTQPHLCCTALERSLETPCQQHVRILECRPASQFASHTMAFQNLELTGDDDHYINVIYIYVVAPV